MQQTPDSDPSSSNQDSMSASAAQANGSVQQEAVGTSPADFEDHTAVDSASPESWPCLRGLEFLENLRDPDNLQPVALPLEMKLFSRVPVVVSARLFGQTGMPSETFARLLIK